MQAGGSIDQNVFKVENAAFGFRQADNDAEVFLSFPKFRCDSATEAGFNDVLNVGNVEAVTSGALAVDGDVGLRNFAHAIDEGTSHASNRANGLENFFGVMAQSGGIFTKDFDHDLAIDLRNAFEHVIANGLAKAGIDAGNGIEGPIDLRDNLFLVHAVTPGFGGFQIHEEFGHVDQLRIGAVFGTARLGNDGIDFGNGFDD